MTHPHLWSALAGAQALVIASMLGTIASLALPCFYVPAVLRLAYARTDLRPYDPMGLVVLMLSADILVFSLLRWVFRMHAETFDADETRARIAAYNVSICAAIVTENIIRVYEGTRK